MALQDSNDPRNQRYRRGGFDRRPGGAWGLAWLWILIIFQDSGVKRLEQEGAYVQATEVIKAESTPGGETNGSANGH